MIEPGTPAPGFSLPDQEGNAVSLASLHGKRFLLVFYPSDFSPVCTEQLSVYEQRLAEIAPGDVEVYGVSVDSAFCHRAFREQLGVSIPLLADFHPKGEVARAYGVYADDYGVALRALVLVGPDGVVEWSHRPSSPLEVPSFDLILDAVGARAA